MATFVNPLVLGKRGVEGFSKAEVIEFRAAGFANGYYADPRITDAQVRESMAREERMINDPEYQARTALFLAAIYCRN